MSKAVKYYRISDFSVYEGGEKTIRRMVTELDLLDVTLTYNNIYSLENNYRNHSIVICSKDAKVFLENFTSVPEKDFFENIIKENASGSNSFCDYCEIESKYITPLWYFKELVLKQALENLDKLEGFEQSFIDAIKHNSAVQSTPIEPFQFGNGYIY